MRNVVLLILLTYVVGACSQIIDNQSHNFTTDRQAYSMMRTADTDDSVSALTIDGQEIWLEVTIVFHITDVEMVRSYWSDIPQSYVEGFIRPTTRVIVRNVVSLYTASDILDDLAGTIAAIETEIEAQLDEELGIEGFAVDEFMLHEIYFEAEDE